MCWSAFRGGVLDAGLIQRRSNCGRDPLMHLRAILLHLQTQRQPGTWLEMSPGGQHDITVYMSITAGDEQLSQK